MNDGQYYSTQQNLRFQPLTADEELDLFRRVRAKDGVARETVITRHLLYAMTLGRRFGSRLPVDETTSAANEALMQAVDRFDPERGFRFRSFLVPYVRAAIARCWRARAPVDFKHGTPPIEVSASYFEENAQDREYGTLLTPPELTTPPTIEQADHEGFLKGELAACAEKLPARAQEIIRLHYVEGFNLAEIGKKLGLSRERIRQIHDLAIATLKTRLEKRGVKSSS